MEGSYTVKTEVFEGPLDLLLELVTKRKLFVNDVSLAQVTDDFIRYIDDPELQEARYGAGRIGEMAEFILIASTLMLIKSKSLLPTLELSEEEEESIHDLENRLTFYARIKELSEKLCSLFGKNIIFEKEPRKIENIVFTPDSKTNPEELLAALNGVIESLPKKEILPKVIVKKVISLEEMIEKLAERISKANRLSFSELHSTKGKLTYEKKVSIIVGFLAMLELIKRGAIRVTQEASGEIEIEKEGVAIPNYSN